MAVGRSTKTLTWTTLFLLAAVAYGVSGANTDTTKLKVYRTKLKDAIQSVEYNLDYALVSFPSKLVKEKQEPTSTKDTYSAVLDTVKMRLDLSSDDTIVGVNPPNDWGLNCNTVDSQVGAPVCVPIDKKPVEVEYQRQKLRDATQYHKVHEALFGNSIFRTKNFTVGDPVWEVLGLTDQTSAGSTSFILKDTGVLGLAPGSTFISYLLTTQPNLNNSFGFTVDYPIAARAGPREKKVANIPEFVLNVSSSTQVPGVRDLTSVGILKATEQGKSWQFLDVAVQIGSQSFSLVDSGTALLCITNTDQSNLIYVKSRSDFAAAIYKQMCDSSTACKLDEVNFEKAPEITVTQNKGALGTPVSIKLIGEEYLIDGGSGLYQESVGDLNSLIADGKCSSESNIALGSQLFNGYVGHFLVKRTTEGQVVKSEKTVELYRKRFPTRLSSQQKFYFMVVSSVMIVIIALITLIKHLSVQKLNQQELGKESWSKDGSANPSIYEDDEMDHRSLIQN